MPKPKKTTRAKPKLPKVPKTAQIKKAEKRLHILTLRQQKKHIQSQIKKLTPRKKKNA